MVGLLDAHRVVESLELRSRKHVVRWRTGQRARAGWQIVSRGRLGGSRSCGAVPGDPGMPPGELAERTSLPVIGHRGVDLLYRSHTHGPDCRRPMTPGHPRTPTAMTSLTLVFWPARDWLLGRS